jgi:hypothetical protein
MLRYNLNTIPVIVVYVCKSLHDETTFCRK